jgi:serralysin
MTTIGSNYLVNAVSQLRATSDIASTPAQTDVSKALSEAQNISLNGGSILLLRQNLNEATDILALVDVSNEALDGIASRLVDLESIEVQLSQTTQGDADYDSLSQQMQALQKDLTDYVTSQSKLKDWALVQDTDGVDEPSFDFTSWAFSVDARLSDKIATIEVKADDLVSKFHNPASCPMCSASENGEFAAAATSNTASTLGSVNDPSTTGVWDALRSGSLWNISGNNNLSYSYYQNVPYTYSNGAGETVTALNATQQADHDIVMQRWDDVVNFEFEKVSESSSSSVGEVRIAYTSTGPAGSAAYAYYPNSGASGGDTWYMDSVSSNDSFSQGTYGFLTALHELGHAIGLKHPFSGAPTLAGNVDNARYTVMTYTQNDRNMIWNITSSGGSLSARAVTVQPITPMLYDVAFAQENYGAETSVRATNTSYTFSSAPEVFQTIVDAGGTDTIDASGITNRSSIIDLTPGTFSSIGYRSIADQLSDAVATYGNGASAWLGNLFGASYTSRLYEWNDNVAIASSATIENALGGGGSDTITGNSADNELWGNGGNDTINGGAGTNTAGFRGNRADYTITAAGGGYTVQDSTGGRDGLDTLSNIQQLRFVDGLYDTSGNRLGAGGGAPTGNAQNASGNSASNAANAAEAATGARTAATIAANTPASSVAITRTAAEKRSINAGRMAVYGQLAGKIRTLSGALRSASTKTTHSMAAMTAPRPYSSASSAGVAKAQAARALSFNAFNAPAPPRMQFTPNALQQAISVNRAQIMAAIQRT